MWQGIIAHPNADVHIINGTFISDAQQALYIHDAHYMIDDAIFDNNYDGVLINNPGGDNGQISNTKFNNSEANLLPPRSGERSRYGVLAIGNNNEINIGPLNTFTRLGTGVAAWMSNLRVQECTFENLNYIPNQQFYSGTGIYAQGDLGLSGFTPTYSQHYLIVEGFGKDAQLPNFKNLRTGIFMQNMNAKGIINNYMNNVQYGVQARLCHGAYVNINENRFANISHTGVQLSNNIGAYILVANNNFTANKVPAVAQSNVGVDVYGFSGNVSNLIIGYNRFDRFNRGVRMNKVIGNEPGIGSMGAHVFQNDFYGMYADFANHVHLTGCEAIDVRENYMEGDPVSVTSNPNTGSTVPQNGIYLQATNGYWIACNNFDNLSTAITALGSNTTGKDNIATNQMHRHYYGWNLRRFATDGEVGTVGPGISNRNDFNDAPSAYHNGVQIWGHDNMQNGTYVFYNSLQDGISNISSNNGNLPFSLISSIEAVNDCEVTPEGDIVFLQDAEPDFEELKAIAVANGTYALSADPLYQEVIDFEARRKVYGQLDADSTLMADNYTLESFYMTSKYHSIGKFREVEKEIAQLSDTTTLKDTVLVSTIRASIRDKQNEIVDSKNYEYNEKRIIGIYESTVLGGNNDFSAQDKTFVTQLSYQCPLVAGQSVYLARSLRSLFDDDNEYNDLDICDGYYKKERPNITTSTLTEAGLRIAPNPANEQCLLVYYVPDGKEAGAALTVRAADGRQLFTTHVLSGGSSVTLNTGNMPIGLYIVELRNNDGLLKATKLSVGH